MDDALNASYLSQEQFADLNNRYDAIGGMLSRMIDRADDFCKYAAATDYRTTLRIKEDDVVSEQSATTDAFFA